MLGARGEAALPACLIPRSAHPAPPSPDYSFLGSSLILRGCNQADSEMRGRRGKALQPLSSSSTGKPAGENLGLRTVSAGGFQEKGTSESTQAHFRYHSALWGQAVTLGF